MPEFLAIGAACKRMRNILRQAEEKGKVRVSIRIFALTPKKRRIWQLISTSMGRESKHYAQKEEYTRRYYAFTAREPVDAFFDKVMVMVEETSVRANRLALLQTLLKEFSTIADFSEIVTEGKRISAES